MTHVDTTQVPDFLEELSLFGSLDEAQIQQITPLFTQVQKNPDDVIIIQGTIADGFYLILEGQVTSRREFPRQEAQVDVLEQSDFFGEDSLLHNHVEPATITALTPLTLLYLEPGDFHQLVHKYPEIANRLSHFIKSHEYMRSLHFDWLNSDEVVYQVQRRHIAYLTIMLILPGMIVLFGLGLLGLAFLSWDSATIRNVCLFLAAILLGIGLGWGIWNWIDWGNDFYIVTNQRVVWIERVIWLYESRIEAPMSTILSVNVQTKFLGRILSYGDVVVTTFTGMIRLATVKDPYQLSSLIAEYVLRSQQNLQRSNIQDMRHSIRHILGEEAPHDQPPAGAKAKPDQRRADQVIEPSLWTKYFGNIFKTRFEEGHTVTYRKHWLLWMKKTWVPLLISLVFLFLNLTFVIMLISGQMEFSTLLTAISLSLLVFLLILLPWMAYHYVDWRNDIYQVTDRSIFDIERRPFGTETKKSASLENILSLEHKRPGFIGYILNVGFVTINVGEAKFTFDYVSHPARVQQDVFNRMHALRIQKQKEEVSRERDRILKLIEIYHDEVGKEQSEQG
jgi:hypothetical protein